MSCGERIDERHREGGGLASLGEGPETASAVPEFTVRFVHSGPGKETENAADQVFGRVSLRGCGGGRKVAFVQRDAGLRREANGTGFWSSQYNRSSTTSSASRAQRSLAVESTYARRQTAQDREYRVSSYEPTPIAAGETVAIAKDNAQVMHGTNLVGTLGKGREFKVLRVVNGWLGAVVEEDGQVKRGGSGTRMSIPSRRLRNLNARPERLRASQYVLRPIPARGKCRSGKPYRQTRFIRLRLKMAQFASSFNLEPTATDRHGLGRRWLRVKRANLNRGRFVQLSAIRLRRPRTRRGRIRRD